MQLRRDAARREAIMSQLPLPASTKCECAMFEGLHSAKLLSSMRREPSAFMRASAEAGLCAAALQSCQVITCHCILNTRISWHGAEPGHAHLCSPFSERAEVFICWLAPSSSEPEFPEGLLSSGLCILAFDASARGKVIRDSR